MLSKQETSFKGIFGRLSALFASRAWLGVMVMFFRCAAALSL